MRRLAPCLTLCALLLFTGDSGSFGLAAGSDSEGPAGAGAAGPPAPRKRDPFRSLIPPARAAARETPPTPRPRPPGLAGIAISEVNVVGIAFNSSARLAVLQGKEKISYFGKVGDRLYDGVIAHIDGDSVDFTEEIITADGKKLQRTLTRRLNQEI
ncbi:MAG: hypothetical protein HYX74_11560 [Acidobacteria bacterium]|nr:hypothetical protein [Acidobacteriota bacterium]